MQSIKINKLKDLLIKWTKITIRTIQNKNTFSNLPQFQSLSEKCIKVTSLSNNSIYIHYCGVPRSLEYQVAK
ncbi:hypothetical protein LCGC14_0832930 [marine sediment metagenome]|uniref:Uncharacterized protein n=1 Tax=marine sediment metagenome TaxID=412755 RepID=A0A0F9PFE6_9ZZZZ